MYSEVAAWCIRILCQMSFPQKRERVLVYSKFFFTMSSTCSQGVHACPAQVGRGVTCRGDNSPFFFGVCFVCPSNLSAASAVPAARGCECEFVVVTVSSSGCHLGRACDLGSLVRVLVRCFTRRIGSDCEQGERAAWYLEKIFESLTSFAYVPFATIFYLFWRVCVCVCVCACVCA